MVRYWRWLPVLAVALATVAIVPVLTVGHMGQANTDTDLSDACDGGHDVVSFRLVVSATQYEGEDSIEARTEILTDGPERRHVITTTDRNDREEQIITEDARYFRIGETDTWERVFRTPGQVTLETDNDAHELFCGYPALTDISPLGRDTVDGRKTHHISATTDMRQKAAILWPPELAGSSLARQFAAGGESFEFWIDEELRVPLRITHVASFPQIQDRSPYGFEATLRYSNFNEPVRITPPENVIDRAAPPLGRDR